MNDDDVALVKLKKRKRRRVSARRELELTVVALARGVRRAVRVAEKAVEPDWGAVSVRMGLLREATELAAHWEMARGKNRAAEKGTASAKEKPVTLLLPPEERERRIREILQLPIKADREAREREAAMKAAEAEAAGPEPESEPGAGAGAPPVPSFGEEVGGVEPEKVAEEPAVPTVPTVPTVPRLLTFREKVAAMEVRRVEAAARLRRQEIERKRANGEFDEADLAEYGWGPPGTG
jgi:hypothetical protein